MSAVNVLPRFVPVVMAAALAAVVALAAGCAGRSTATVDEGSAKNKPLTPAEVASYKATGDWCPEHGLPESLCLECNPELAAPPPEPPAGADLQRLSEQGEDVASLAPHLVPGKVTVFDFYADWCGPCRLIDEHMYALLAARDDLAYRKLNVVSWDTPLAKHYLAQVSGLPYLVVYGRKGALVKAIAGFHLDELDAAIAAGARQ